MVFLQTSAETIGVYHKINLTEMVNKSATDKNFANVMCIIIKG